MSDGRAGATRRGPALPDLAYVVRPGEENDELRFSLRSVAANMSGYRKVWIVGTVPSWLRNIEALPLEPEPEKFANMRQSLSALCAHRGVAKTVAVMNDDHFVIEPIDARELPIFHLDDTAAYAEFLVDSARCGRGNTWLQAMRLTAEWVAQHGGEPRCYESHTPLPFDRARLGKLLAEYPADQRLAYPQLYPLAGAGPVGTNAGNAKVAALDSSEFAVKVGQAMPYLSSNDRSFADGMVGGYIRGMFREASKYEEAR